MLFIFNEFIIIIIQLKKNLKNHNENCNKHIIYYKLHVMALLIIGAHTFKTRQGLSSL